MTMIHKELRKEKGMYSEFVGKTIKDIKIYSKKTILNVETYYSINFEDCNLVFSEDFSRYEKSIFLPDSPLFITRKDPSLRIGDKIISIKRFCEECRDDSENVYTSHLIITDKGMFFIELEEYVPLLIVKISEGIKEELK